MIPAVLSRRTPGRPQAVLIRYGKINKGAELLLNTSPCTVVMKLKGRSRSSSDRGLRWQGEGGTRQQPQIRRAHEAS